MYLQPAFFLLYENVPKFFFTELYSSSNGCLGGMCAFIAQWFRFFQIVLNISICGLYEVNCLKDYKKLFFEISSPP